MNKIYKQMFDNKIIQIIALIWLLKQPQLNLSVAGQPAMALTTQAIITAAAAAATTTQLQQEYKKNIEKHVIKTYDMTRSNTSANNSSTSTGNSNSTTTASNKLNVNNTDTQMTLKLKDATAINAFTANYMKTFTLETATQSNKTSNTIEYTPNRTNATATRAAGKSSQNITNSSPTTVLLSPAIPANYTTRPYLNHKGKLNSQIQENSKINLENTEQTTAQNSIMNINLINTMDLSKQQQQLGKTNKILTPRTPKDTQETTSKSKANAELIEKDKSLQAVNKSSQTAGKSLQHKQKGKNFKQTFFKTTDISSAINRVERGGKNEVKIQKQLKIFNHSNFGSDTRKFSEKIKTSNENFRNEKISNMKNSTIKTFDLPQVRQSLTTHITNNNNNNLSAMQLEKFDEKEILAVNLQAANFTYKPEFYSTSTLAKNNGIAASNNFEPKTTKASQIFGNTKQFKEILQPIDEMSATAIASRDTLALLEHKMEQKLSNLKKIEQEFVENLDSEIKQIHNEYMNIKSELGKQNRKEIKNTSAKVTQTNKQNLKKQEITHSKIKTGILIVRQETGYRETNKHEQFQKENSNNNAKPSLHENKHTKKIPLNTTFQRTKRLNSNQQNVESPIALPNFQLENSTGIYHNNNLSERNSNASESYKLNQNKATKSTTKKAPQSMVNINEPENTLTEYIPKSNFINQRKESALNTVSGNGNNTMKINSLENNKPMDSNSNKNNLAADNGKHAVNETNAINLKTTTRPSVMETLKSKTEAKQKQAAEAITNGYSVTDINSDNITPTAVTRGHIWDFQSTLATALTTPATFNAQNFSIYHNRVTASNTPPTFTAAEDLLATLDLITTTEESVINSLAITQLSSYTSSNLPYKYAANMTVPPKLATSLVTSLPFIAATAAATTTTSSWPVKHASVMEGNVILGGLMMVHSREDSITCGPIMPQGGIQALEAMLYTLDQVNKQQLLPNITLGAHILDDCDKDTYGLEMAVDFIKGESNCPPQRLTCFV